MVSDKANYSSSEYRNERTQYPIWGYGRSFKRYDTGPKYWWVDRAVGARHAKNTLPAGNALLRPTARVHVTDSCHPNMLSDD